MYSPFPGPAEALSLLHHNQTAPLAQTHFLPFSFQGVTSWETVYTSYPVSTWRIQPVTLRKSTPIWSVDGFWELIWCESVSEPHILKVGPWAFVSALGSPAGRGTSWGLHNFGPYFFLSNAVITTALS